MAPVSSLTLPIDIVPTLPEDYPAPFLRGLSTTGANPQVSGPLAFNKVKAMGELCKVLDMLRETFQTAKKFSEQAKILRYMYHILILKQ